MKRIDVMYGSQIYSIGGRELDDIKAEIERALTAGRPHWLEVNDGEGEQRAAHLLIQPGIDIAFIPIPG